MNIPRVQSVFQNNHNNGHTAYLSNGKSIDLDALVAGSMLASAMLRTTMQKAIEQEDEIIRLRALAQQQNVGLWQGYNTQNQLNSKIVELENELNDQGKTHALIEQDLRKAADRHLNQLTTAAHKLLKAGKELTANRSTVEGLLGVINGSSSDNAKNKALRILTQHTAAVNAAQTL